MEEELFLKELMKRNYRPLNEVLPGAVVGIAGCGGLGSNIAHMLTRAGIGKLIIADYDIVAMTDLNRQFFFFDDLEKYKVDALEATLLKINPFLKVEKHNIKITLKNLFDIFKGASIITEAFDRISQKSMIIDTFLEKGDKTKYLVTASGMGGIEPSNLIKTKKFKNNIFLCGDFKNDLHLGLMSPRVNIAAAHQANMVLRILAGKPNPS